MTFKERRAARKARKAAKLAKRPYRPLVSYSSNGRNQRRLKRAVAGGSNVRADLVKPPKWKRAAPDLTGTITI